MTIECKTTPTRSVTVVTVCYNAKLELSKTIKSVLAQEGVSFSYVIIDGNSNDGTQQFLTDLSRKIKVENRNVDFRFICEDDKGIYDAMNKACNFTKHSLVIFMNAGDLFSNSSVLKHIATSGDIVAAYGDTIVDYGNRFVYRASKKTDNHYKFYIDKPYSHQSIFLSNDFLDNHPFDVSYEICADFKQFHMLKRNGVKFDKFDIPISVISVGGVSDLSRSRVNREKIGIVKELFGKDAMAMQLFYYRNLIVEIIKGPVRKYIRKLND